MNYRCEVTYAIVFDLHVTHVVHQGFTRLLLAPVGRGVQWRPAVVVLRVHIGPRLQQNAATKQTQNVKIVVNICK